jgi:ankyrin repeat protein
MSLDLEARDKLLSSLHFDQIDNRLINIKPGHSSTCDWFLCARQFSEGLDDTLLSQHHGFFWVKGKPGSGKSTLAKFVFTNLQEKRSHKTVLLSFFFNARGSLLEKSTFGLYRSLLVQILEKCYGDERNCKALRLRYWPPEEQLTTEIEVLKQFLAQAIQVLVGYNIKVIIDALDEGDEDEVRDMVAFFTLIGDNTVAKNESSFRVLFLSRHYPHITIQRSVEMILEDQIGHTHDLKKYIWSELNIGQGTQSLEIKHNVHSRSSGVFMWAVLVVQILNKAFDHGQVHTLRKKLQDIPDDLNRLFGSILTRDSHNLDEMKLCLQWVLYAKRPLSLEELYFAIMSGIQPDCLTKWKPDIVTSESMELFILSSSKGLAEVTRSNKRTVQFIHESVRDFLLKENGLGQIWNALQHNSLGLSHDRLKDCCLNYVRSIDMASLELEHADRFPINLSIEDIYDENGELKPPRYRRIERLKTFPFLQYAVWYIFDHANVSQGTRLSQELFMKQIKLGHWIQMKNLFEFDDDDCLPLNTDMVYILTEGNYSNLLHFSTINAAGTETKKTLRYGNALCVASSLGYTGVVKLLINYGADVNVSDKRYGNSLCAASYRGFKDIVEMLLNHGAEINVEDNRYANPLTAASSRGRSNVVHLLIERGANLNVENKRYCNALCAASMRGHTEVVKLLLDRGANINAQDTGYGNSLFAASAGYQNEIVELLLARGANINAKAEKCGNALYAAITRYGYMEEYNRSLKRPRRTYVSDELEAVLESSASEDSEAETTELPTKRRSRQMKGLEQRQREQDAKYQRVIRLLLDNGIDVNMRSRKHGTALRAALVRGHNFVAMLLLDKGAIGIPDGIYGSAVEIAIEGRKQEIVDLPQ